MREASEDEFYECYDRKNGKREHEDPPVEKSDKHADTIGKKGERHEPENRIHREYRIPKISLHEEIIA